MVCYGSGLCESVVVLERIMEIHCLKLYFSVDFCAHAQNKWANKDEDLKSTTQLLTPSYVEWNI